MVALFAIVRDVFVHNLLLSNFANTSNTNICFHFEYINFPLTHVDVSGR